MSDRVVDQELVERVQAGDKRAFDLLVLKYQRKVQRLVSRFVRDSGEVDDVVQEAFIKALSCIADLSRRRSVLYVDLPNCHQLRQKLFGQPRAPDCPDERFDLR